MHPGLRHHLLAVDRGTTETLLDHQLPQLERSGAAPAVVTLMVGGNDLLRRLCRHTAAQPTIEVVRRRVDEALRRLRRLLAAPSESDHRGHGLRPRRRHR